MSAIRKSALAFLFVLVTVKGNDHKAEVLDCFINQNAVTAEQFAHFLATYEASHNLKCALRCVASEGVFDVIDASGRYMPEETAEAVPQNLAAASRECAHMAQPTSDICEVSYAFHKCLYMKLPTEYVDYAKSFDIKVQ